ncbi:hypothetical protein OEZ85_010458 [Tetradesmus obliquus]|uniref:SNF2 super family n=1 Tax=Tetradesmus obliquus TaxID=3088 RepID=A0ABY8TMC4_TETOB|nr:hypothetical protein OEZ85_010458 [Tetradesmus obliquus]
MCPGVFNTCGATLHWRQLGNSGNGFWGCCLYPQCEYRYFPAQQLSRPELGCEVVDGATFRLVPQPAAEVAVAAAGGLRAVLAAAGINLDPQQGAAPAAEVAARFAAMPASLRGALMPFQRQGVAYGLARRGRVLIADEMGVGKTVQALALAACYQDEWPLLVIVPASLRLVWAEEVERWLPHVRPGQVTVIEGKEDRLCDLPEVGRRATLPQITITSYEMMKRLSCPACQKLPGHSGSGGGRGGRGGGRGGRGGRGAAAAAAGGAGAAEGVDAASAAAAAAAAAASGGRAKHGGGCTGPDHCMAALPWGVIIMDESHNLRTTNSRGADSPHTEAAVAAGAAARRLILLSGTPSLSRPYDLFRQVDVLVPRLLGRSKEEFAHRYCDRRLVPVAGSHGEGRLRWDNRGGCRLGELHGLLVRSLMVRRLKRDVMAQLPPKRRQVVRLPYPPPHCWPKQQEPGKDKQHNAAAAAAAAAGASGAPGAADTADKAESAGVMSVAHRTALAKLPDAIDWLIAALGGGGEDGEEGAGPAAGGSRGSSRGSKGPLVPAWKASSGSSSNSTDGGGAACDQQQQQRDQEEAGEEADGDDEGAAGDRGSGGGSGGSPGPKFLVFAHHRDVMDQLAAALAGYGSHVSSSSDDHPDEVEAAAAAAAGGAAGGRRRWHGVGYVRVDGSHDSTERLAAVRRFKADPSVRVALLSITAAAVGLDFSAASMVVFVELPAEVALVRQAEDRAHRKGQAAKAVNVYFLCAQGTQDDKQWQALNTSLAHISQVHDGQAEMLPQPSFAADWGELRSITRNRLAGKVIPPDMSAAVEAVSAAAASSGAFGVGVVRYMRDIQEGDPCLPPGAKLVQVTVHYPQGRQPLVVYRQAFTGPCARHCVNCFRLVEGCSLPQDAVLQGSLDLFCSLDCERLFFIKNSSSGIRRALFRLERGVCQACRLDCHALVQQLQQISKDTPGWQAQRRAVVAHRAPAFLARGCTAYLDKLLDQATEGHAWHADHILAVYEGGGGCDMDNLRTLCVPCHAAVTKRQAAARAAERQRRRLNTHDIRSFFGPGGAAAAAAGADGAVRQAQLKRKRRGKAEGARVYVDDLTTPEPCGKTAKKTAGAPPTAAAAAAAGGAEHVDQEISTPALAIMTGLFGSTFVGPVGHFWYINLDKWCARAFPGGGAKFIAAKVLLDTAAMGPFYVAAFFAWGCALIDFSGMAEFKRKMAVDFLPTLAAEVTLWPVIQGINFTFVPLKHQLLVVNTMTIFDACFMSWSRNQDDWLAKVKGWIGADGAVVAEEQQQQQGKKGSKKQQRQLEVAPLRLEGPGKR